MSDNYQSTTPNAAKLHDRNYKGEDFHVDQKLEHGPLVERKCTNVLCAGVFGVFLIGMLTCVIMGFINGNVGELMAPVDSDGNICGYNTTTVGYPYLYISNYGLATSSTGSSASNSMFTSGVCVESCPAQNATINCVNTVDSSVNGTESVYGTWEFMGYCWPDST